ncbi:MAG: triose-phosphate isomerase, partial [Candidatus Micrarchaeota archaeon]|nr:triose-phosphate isomerase [Candidatus Micrarchaeota archaeon]
GKQVKEGLAGVTAEQLANLAIAYEPRWAIGEGKTPPAPEDAQKVHAYIRKILRRMFGKDGKPVRIQYGGNANPENIGGFMAQPDINGALVGGASLKADAFAAIVRGARV